MKFIVMLCDGMADRPVAQLGGKTPMETAKKPVMDRLASKGAVGMARTVPLGMPPGSDTANLSVMGYDPRVFYTGRSPLEAASMGIALGPRDVAFRCNLVTLSDADDIQNATMIDYCSEEISTEEAALLIDCIRHNLSEDRLEFFCGISYRHCMVIRGGQTGTHCTPPHDITGKPVDGHLPTGIYGARILDIMQRSRALLEKHPVNLSRIERGLRPANACWLWGEGTRPALASFADKYGIKGGVVSAVDLVKGIGLCAGLQSVNVPGATGNIHTNFTGKAHAALKLLAGGCDFVYIHVEAPDECGHQNQIHEKVKAIELIDSQVLAPIVAQLEAKGEPFSILVAPDHPTPLELRTHTDEPVPFILWRSDRKSAPSADVYTELSASQTGFYVDKGYQLMDLLISGNF